MVQHVKTNHPSSEQGEKSLVRSRKIKLVLVQLHLNFSCDQCGYTYIHCRNLDRHVSRNHTAHPAFSCTQCEKSFARSYNLEMHTHTCTGPVVVQPTTAPAVKRRCISGVTPEFVVRKTHGLLGDALELFAVNMNGAMHMSALQKAVPVMGKFHREHCVYKFQIAVDLAVITEPPVTLASEMIAVYADTVPPLEDVNRQLVNLVEVYEHNGSGWVFSKFASLQVTLWHLDPLRAIAFVPIPRWIQEKSAVTNVIGTGDDCFNWLC